MPDRLLRSALGALLFLGFAGCSEQVTGSVGCPQLCADESAQLRDTVLVDGVVLDSTLIGYPRLGAATQLVLTGGGDTADVRAIVRFDTLPNKFRRAGATDDSLITRVDSATLIFALDSTFARPTGLVGLEAFDVDTTAADTIPRALLPLFRPDRLIGSSTFSFATGSDTVRLPISNAAVLGKLSNGGRLRIGLRVSNPAGNSEVRLAIRPSLAPVLRFRVSTDTLVPVDTVRLTSLTPRDLPGLAAALTLYPVVARGALPAPPNSILAIGGLGGARSYLQFSIPSIVLDSVQVIRATLQLTQRPSRAAGFASDTISLIAGPIVSAPSITDLSTAIQFMASDTTIHALRLVPRDSGRRDLEIVHLVRSWRSASPGSVNRSLVLRVAQEGVFPGELDFYSSEAPVELRPKLRLTYVPRRGFGLP